MPDPAMFEVWNPLRGKAEQKSPYEVRMQQLVDKEAEIAERERQVEMKQQALAEQMQQAEALLGNMTQVLDSMEQSKRKMVDESKNELIDFAFGLAERVVQAKIGRDANVIINAISTSLQSVDIEGAVEIHLCPADLHAIQSLDNEEAKKLMNRQQVQWRANNELMSGDIWIDTSHYRLDASLLRALGNLHEDVIKASMASGGDIVF